MTPRRLLYAVVCASDRTPPTANVDAYLYGGAKGPLTGKADRSRVRTCAPAAADSFAVTLARDLRQHGRADLARPVVSKLWKTGVRDPYLTTLYAA
ncbi:MAG: hypothetical protein LH616_02235, partial [Ilumatobacteraceae bacterium]|nr:hypothetical protein [Ilumatobacteraceae bacterium]